ncbi:MAG TPA: hypothetical protein VM287_12765 [Egibacteraceae bacterium]|nr:hypothetical protein [Egibacteraceae bacterium]
MSDDGDDEGLVYRFVWIEDDAPALGGQWLAFPPDGRPYPVALADAVVSHRDDSQDGPDPLQVHVEAAHRIVEAAGDLEDRLFPDARHRLAVALVAADAGVPQIDPDAPEGEAVRRTAEALEKVAADCAELVEEQLRDGSLAMLPRDFTGALCQAVQAGWRLRRLVDPPGPLYL